jgi:cell division protein FtsW
LFGLALLATLVGLVLIFDAGYARSLMNGRGVIPREFLTQALFTPVAIALAAFASRFTPEALKRFSTPLWVLTLLSLVLVLVPGLGVEMGGAQRWLKLGPLTVQPAEFAKLFGILFVAGIFAGRPLWPKRIPRRRDFVHWLETIAIPKFGRIVPALLILVGVGLIEAEPDLGTAAVVAFVAFAMFCVGGASKRSILVGIAIAVAGAFFMVHQQPYRLERVTSHAARWSVENMDDIGFQTVQSEMAIASGGILGTGIGSGRAKHILPATTTDFIYATVGEEFGLVGAMLLLGLLAALTLRLMVLATRAPTPYGALVLFGVGCWIGLQSTVNVMMANGTFPAIGLPMPFISSGGSSLVALWLAIGASQAALAPARAPSEVEGQKEKTRRASHRNRWRNRRARLSRA